MFESVVFEFADGELDDSVVAVEPVGFDGGEGVVADERVVAPGWPHRSLGGVSESGAAHDQPDVADLFAFPGGVDRFGDLGVTATGVVDRGPSLFRDRSDRCLDFGDKADRDRPANTGLGEFVDEFPGPEPRIGPDRDRPAHPGPADRGEDLADEPENPTGGPGGAFTHPRSKDLTGAGTGGDQRVIAQHTGVAVGGALLLFAVDLGDGRVEIDHQLLTRSGSGARRPRVGQQALFTLSSWRT